MCWYCYWGLPERVAEIFDRAESDVSFDATRYGPGHIVFDDFNLDDDSVKHCIKACDDYTQHWTPEVGAAVKPYLEELLAIPEEERDPAPEGSHFSDNPKLYPPPEGVKMVRR